MSRFLPSPKAFFLCLLSALLVCLSFPNFLDKSLFPWGAPLVWISLIPFFWALRGATPKRGAVLGFTFGFLHLGGILYWIAFLQEAKYLSGLAWFVLMSYLSLYFLVFGELYCFLRDRLGKFEVLLAPILWTALEFIRGTKPLGGFPWGQLGYAAAPYPSLLHLTSWTGVYGLTFMIVWANASFTKGFDLWNAGEKFLSKPCAYFGVTLLVLGLLGFLGYRQTQAPTKDLGYVALFQPNIDQSVKWDKAYEEKTYDILESLAGSVNPGEFRLAVWPETAAPSFLFHDPKSYERVSSIVKRGSVPTLVGFLDAEGTPGKNTVYYNAALQMRADGRPDGIYQKVHLVPFGEFVPFQKQLSFLGPVIQNLGELGRGKGYARLEATGFSFSPLICYEVIFPEEVRESLANGADALVNISNDAWYGDTASPYQHAMMAVVRAAENRRPLLRSSNSGICLSTDPFGRVLSFSRLFDRTALKSGIILCPGGKTLYAEWGSWFPKLCLFLSAAIFVLALAGKPALPGRRAEPA